MNKSIYFIIFMLGFVTAGPSSSPEVDLPTILKNSADYCERLNKAAFRCLCMETVKETIKDQGGKSRKKSFLYDYQVVGKGGKIEETRSLIEVNGEPVTPQKNAKLETEFYSRFSIYAPIFLLARENQEKYNYRLVKKERIKGVKTWVLEVEPLDKRGVSIFGRIWLDQKDFSVICIEINPEAMGGVQKQLENAGKIGAKLLMSDTHWYEVARAGIRFPSRTEISEKYKFSSNIFTDIQSLMGGTVRPDPGNSTWNRSNITFTYDCYQFFDILKMEVKERLSEE
jgi:hypothetical protein